MIAASVRAHITWKLREAEFYLGQLKNASEQIFGTVRQFGFAWGNPQHQGYAQVFLFLFSGFLSAFRCVTFYMEKVCDDRVPPSTWYEAQKRAAAREHSLLAAFCFLRDADVHERTLSTSPGVVHTVNIAEQKGTSEFNLNAKDLATIDKLRERPWAVEALTAASVIAISEKVLEDLKAVVEAGKAEGLF